MCRHRSHLRKTIHNIESNSWSLGGVLAGQVVRSGCDQYIICIYDIVTTNYAPFCITKMTHKRARVGRVCLIAGSSDFIPFMAKVPFQAYAHPPEDCIVSFFCTALTKRPTCLQEDINQIEVLLISYIDTEQPLFLFEKSMHYTGEDNSLVMETEGGRKNLYLDSEILRNKALSHVSCFFFFAWKITRRKYKLCVGNVASNSA